METAVGPHSISGSPSTPLSIGIADMEPKLTSNNNKHNRSAFPDISFIVCKLVKVVATAVELVIVEAVAVVGMVEAEVWYQK